MPETNATLYNVRNSAAWITMNRPENRNALSAALVNEIYAHLEQANSDASVRSIVITGSAPAFCAGADLKSPPGSTIDGGGKAVPYADLLVAICDSPKPVIAAVNGAAFAGGLGLLGAADLVITDAAAILSFSEVRIGVIPAVISVVCLPKLGVHHASRLFLTGERFNGMEAVDYGLAHEAVDGADLVSTVEAEVERLNLGGPNAVPACKKLISEISKLPRDEGFELAAKWSTRMFNSDEASEGMLAFREKRSPAWVDS